jgi:GT2 family glycosyltransferase
MNSPVKLSVLLPTYRQPEALVLTLRDLQQQDYPPEAWELVILDDGSRDATSQLALASVANDIAVTLKRSPRGGTYSHAALFNELLRLADPATQVLVNVEDARLRPDLLRQHAKWHTDSSLRLVSGPMYEGPKETFEAETCDRWKLMEISGVTASAYRCCFQAVFAKSMSYSAALRDALTEPSAAGPFDEAMTGYGYHENEFALRASLAGATCIYDTTCGVYHPLHHQRDERDYRGIDRTSAQKAGMQANVDYLCDKHGLDRLPDWEVGIPLADVPPVWVPDGEHGR